MPLSEARKKANAKYNAKAYDRIEIKVKKGEKDTITEHAKDRAESVNGFINRAIEETIQRDTKAGEADESV